jgi:hypothetical protein
MRPEQLDSPEATLDEDLRRLDVGIRQLKIQYEMYFAGGLKKPPFVLQSSVKKIIKRYCEEVIPKYHQRFLYSSLVTRYNILAELWSKRVRDSEEGPRRAAPPLAAAAPTGPRLVAVCRVRDPGREGQAIRELYETFIEARRACGLDAAGVGFEKFARGVAAHVNRLQSQKPCRGVEIRVLVEGQQIELRARPLTRDPEPASSG